VLDCGEAPCEKIFSPCIKINTDTRILMNIEI